MEYHPLSFEDDLFTARVYKRNYRTKISHRIQEQSPPVPPINSSAISTQTAKHQSKEAIDKTQLQRLVGKGKTTTDILSEIANEGAEDDAKHTEFGRNSILVTTSISVTTSEGSYNLGNSSTPASTSYEDLVLACRRGDNDSVKKQLATIPVSTHESPQLPTLLARNTSDSIHFCPITAAVFRDHVEVMRTLLQRAELENDLKRVVEKAIGGNEIIRWRPLHVATLKCSFSMVKLLLQNGASVHSEIGHGIFTVHLAARSGHFEILSALVEAGANLDQEDLDGLTPRKYLSTSDNNDCKQMTLQLRHSVHPTLARQIDSPLNDNAYWPYKPPPKRSLKTLNITIRLGLPLLMEEHIEDGFDPNHCRDDGGTGLHTLVWSYCFARKRDESSDKRILRLLLGVVNLFAKDNRGYTVFNILSALDKESSSILESHGHTMNGLARLIAETLPQSKYVEKSIVISMIDNYFCWSIVPPHDYDSQDCDYRLLEDQVAY